LYRLHVWIVAGTDRSLFEEFRALEEEDLQQALV